jgi:hypothetical protein
MDNGRVAEYDSPSRLLSDRNSIFYGMCERSGDRDIITSIANAKEMNESNTTM